MKISEVGKRYARALFGVAQELKKSEQFLAELRAVLNVLESQPEVSSAMESPNLAPAHKLEAIQKAFGGKASQEIVNFLCLLIEKKRWSHLAEVTVAFEEAIDESRGVTRGTVRSASALDPQQRKALEEKARSLTGREVIFSYHTDPQLVGGLIAEVKGWTMDDTLTSHLRSMKEQLKHQN
jgi:F-type H+-transporting ATPase subunit delta